MNISISRQPIYNEDFAADGYELLYEQKQETSSTSVYSGLDSTFCRIMTNAFFGFTPEELANGSIPYVNVTNELLIDGLPELYKPNQFIMEVLPNLFLDDKLAKYVSYLHHKGFKLALKSYNPRLDRTGNLNYLGMFDVVRVDISQDNRLKIKESVRLLRKYRMRLLAENISTPEELALAHELGFDLFQGSVFGESPNLTRDVSLRVLPYGKLFNHLLTGRVNRGFCARIILEDPALTHMFLRKTFNNRHNRKAPDLEVDRGLEKISDEKFRHWAAAYLLDQVSTESTEELIPGIFCRGLIMERLAAEVDLGVTPGKAFMFGIASALDRITGESMEKLIPQLAFGDAMKAALVFCKNNGYMKLWEAAQAYEENPESPDWPDTFSDLSDQRLSKLVWECQINTEYLILATSYTVRPEPYKGNILSY